MTTLPDASAFTASTVTEGAFKAALTQLIGCVAGLTGTDGTIATALATLGTLGGRWVSKSAAYSVVVADRGSVIDATGTWALALPSVAGAGAGFNLLLRNSGTGTITVDPAGSEQVDGAATIAVTPGRAVVLTCTGTAWVSMWMVADPGNVGALTPAADKAVYFTSASASALMTVTSFARSILDDVDAAAVKTTLGLGTAVLLGGINGAVAMDSAGVATGAVLEEGVNKNGRWIKFASGLMICTRDAFLLGRCATANGSAYSSASTSWTFPVAFAAPPVVMGGANDVDVEISTAAPTSSAVAVRAQSPVAKSVILSGQLTAIGRWGTVGVASPAGPATLKFWYDPSDVSTLWQDTAATVPVTQPGDPVGRINDKSGSGYHLLQATSTKRPTWNIDADGHGYLQFDGTDDILSAAAVDLSGTASLTLFAAVSRSSTSAGMNVAEMSTSFSSNPGCWRIAGQGTGDTWNIQSNGTAVVSATPAGVGVNAVTVLSAIASISAPLLQVRRNGTQTSSDATSQGTGSYSSQTLYVGSRGTGAFPLAGRIYGLIGYTSALAPADIKAVEDWLNQRAGAY